LLGFRNLQLLTFSTNVSPHNPNHQTTPPPTLGWLALLSAITHSKGTSVFTALLQYFHNLGHG